MPHLSPERARDVWRHVATHVDVAAALHAIESTLREATPLSWIVVHRWTDAPPELDAEGVIGLDDASRRLRLNTPKAAQLVAWAGRRELTTWPYREVVSIARLLVPEGVDGPASAAPLFHGDTLIGVVVAGGLVDPEALADIVEPLAAALHNHRERRSLARLKEAAEADRTALLERLGRQDISGSLIGADAGLRSVLERVAQVAPTTAPVLLLGETGTGKDVVAREIHLRSPRAEGPFFRVNCGAIPTELVDTTLFGHERGAFTGAVATRAGWFERADGGTLFLDEVGELPLAAQVRMLGVLQDGTFHRVGGHDAVVVDVRIVAATHRDLPALVRDGTFRHDLWYRLGVFPLWLPALRDRKGDVPALARYFAERTGLRLFGRPLVPTADDVRALQGYAWPGNVRELAAVIERAAILGDGQGLHIDAALGTSPSTGASDSIEAVLARCHGRIEGPFGAAKALGVHPATLRSRLRARGIEWRRFRSR